MALRILHYPFAIAALAWICAVGALAQNSTLVVNPVFARDMPVPGWIGDHRDAWVGEHPVYRASCETAEVIKEIRFLNRVIAYDEYLLSLAVSSDADNPTTERLASVAKQSAGNLRRDITTADALVAQLRLLPSCDDVKAVGVPPAQAMQATTGAAPPARSSAEPAPPLQTVVSPAPPLAKAAPDVALEPAPSDRVVIRFDNRVAALTPSGIRAFDQAVTALRTGKRVQLAIDGCEPGADFANGSSCARRLATLKQMLVDNGVRDVKRALADLP
jgi:hypothetical protein